MGAMGETKTARRKYRDYFECDIRKAGYAPGGLKTYYIFNLPRTREQHWWGSGNIAVREFAYSARDQEPPDLVFDTGRP